LRVGSLNTTTEGGKGEGERKCDGKKKSYFAWKGGPTF